MLVRAALLWIGVNVGILAILAVLDLALLVKRWMRRGPRRAVPVGVDEPHREPSIA